jgi:hypothetical protein
MGIQSKLLERARAFVYNNARLLDRRRFEYFFEGGSKEAVLSSLAAYQNEDGGFGHALEPDIRCPMSQPVPVELALTIMDEIQCYDPAIFKGIIRYLKQITLPAGGVPLAFRNINEYPHAPWWTTEQDHIANINPTGHIMGLMYKQQINTDVHFEEWFQRTTTYIWNHIENEKPNGYHDGIQWITFLEHTPERSRAESHLSVLEQWLTGPGIIEQDVNAEGYVHKVLDWAPSRDSYAARLISEEVIQQHLSHLVGQQQEDGGWPINWPALSPANHLEWRGYLTVERLKTLHSYGWFSASSENQ